MADILIAMGGAHAVARELGPLPAGLTVAAAETAEDAVPLAGDARVIAGMPRIINQAVIDAAPRLELLQMMTSGVDLIRSLKLPEGVAVATGRGIHGPQLSELAFYFMLNFLRDVRGQLARQANAQWGGSRPRVLLGRHIVIVGVGSISEALASRCQAFGMKVTGLSASRNDAPGFDAIRPMTDLKAAVGEADFAVILTPLTPATTGLIDAGMIAAMPAHAVLINLARGPVVDEAALIDALQRGAIAGAGLDVFEREPLPADSPLWQLDNVLITPHTGGASDRVPQQFAPLVADNVARWFASPRQELRNRVFL